MTPIQRAGLWALLRGENPLAPSAELVALAEGVAVLYQDRAPNEPVEPEPVEPVP